MDQLKLRLLGEIEVLRDGELAVLPPSRKTRALLAYLALNKRAMRRDRLCELLWEIPDDPRGSLRWSLSKLRKVVDEENAPRIIADRKTVAFDDSSVDIDVQSLNRLAGSDLGSVATEVLRAAVEEFSGEFLEGLELSNFHEFYSWCVASREQAMRSRVRILEELIERLVEEPDTALSYANRLVSLVPDDESARARLISLLVLLGRSQEAQQQYRAGMQRLEEIGATATGELKRALQGTASKPAVAATPDPVTTDSSVIGREDEISYLAKMIRELGDASLPQLVLIRGEPGIGKSLILQICALLAREAGASLLKANAYESEMVRPFAVWNDALRRALPDNPTSALLASRDAVSRDQVFESLSAVLNNEAARQPVVVLCDDVQWCDESSVSALSYIMRMNRAGPLLVIATSRNSELRDNQAVQQVLRSLRHDNLLRELQLNPLSDRQLAELIGASFPEIDAQKLGSECGGNPLLALELARAEASGDGVSSLSELVQERLSRMEDGAEDVLLWAAVLSPRINLGTLEQVTGLDRGLIENALELAEGQGILRPGERGLRFSHDLVGRCVYEQISPARRQSMHRRVAELLEVGSEVDLALSADLSFHAQRCGDPLLAARAMVSAGKLCLRFYANADALDLAQRGIDYAAQLGEADRVAMTLELLEIRLMAAPREDWRAETAECLALAESALDFGDLIHARLGYQMASMLRWAHGQWRDAQRSSLQAERVTRSADDEQAQIFGLGEAAKCLAMLERDLDQADAMAMEASALAVRANIQCPPAPAAQGILSYYEGKMDAAVEHLEYARTLAKVAGDRFNEFLANEYLAVTELDRGEPAAALDHCRAMVSIGTKIRQGSERSFALALQAACLYALEGHQQDLEECIEELRIADAKQRLSIVLNRVAIVDLDSGELALSGQRAGEALSLASRMERPTEVLIAMITLEQLHQCDPGLNPRSFRVEIEDFDVGRIASWLQQRARNVLLEGVGDADD